MLKVILFPLSSRTVVKRKRNIHALKKRKHLTTIVDSLVNGFNCSFSKVHTFNNKSSSILLECSSFLDDNTKWSFFKVAPRFSVLQNVWFSVAIVMKYPAIYWLAYNSDENTTERFSFLFLSRGKIIFHWKVKRFCNCSLSCWHFLLTFFFNMWNYSNSVDTERKKGLKNCHSKYLIFILII